MEAQHTIIQWTCLEVKRLKVKVTRRINAHTVNVQYLPNGKAYELQTWYIDGARRPASATSAVTFKVKAQCRKVTWCVWQVLVDKSRTKRPRKIKIDRKIVHSTSRAIMRPKFKVKGQGSRSPGRLMLRPKVRHIYRTERTTNFKLVTQMKHEDQYDHKRHDLQGRKSRSRCHVVHLTGVGP